MAIYGPNGRPLKSITLDGVEMRPRDAVFVVYGPGGVIDGTLPSNHELMDSIPRAARAYWMGDSPAIENLNRGYRIVLMSSEMYRNTIAAAN